MAYFNTCTKCGCNLDPGEKCDCEEEVERMLDFVKFASEIDVTLPERE